MTWGSEGMRVLTHTYCDRSSLCGFTHPASYIGWLHMNAGALPGTLKATGEQVVLECNVKNVPVYEELASQEVTAEKPLVSSSWATSQVKASIHRPCNTWGLQCLSSLPWGRRQEVQETSSSAFILLSMLVGVLWEKGRETQAKVRSHILWADSGRQRWTKSEAIYRTVPCPIHTEGLSTIEWPLLACKTSSFMALGEVFYSSLFWADRLS